MPATLDRATERARALDRVLDRARSRRIDEYTITIAQDWQLPPIERTRRYLPRERADTSALDMSSASPAPPEHPMEAFVKAADAYREAARVDYIERTDESLQALKTTREAYFAANEAIRNLPYTFSSFSIPFASATHGRP